MKAQTYKRTHMPIELCRTLFVDRSRQFVDRLGWNLCVTPDGCEVDEYDDDQSEYLMVHEGSRHIGSCRVRPVYASTMLIDHFSSSFPEVESFLSAQKGRVYELTRFCRAPDVSSADSKKMLECLAVLLDAYRDRRNLTGFVAVVFPHVARFLDSIGVRYLLVAKSEIAGKTVFLICITHAVKATCRSSEYIRAAEAVSINELRANTPQNQYSPSQQISGNETSRYQLA